MKRIAKLTIVITVFSVISVFGQTRTEIEAKFGQPVKAYAVSEHVWMSPDYASDGQVCRMTFYPRRFSSNTHYLTSQLPFNEFMTVIDAVVPVAVRGAQKEPFGTGGWSGGGGVMWTSFVYERVTITYSASFPTVDLALGSGEPVNLDLPDEDTSKRQEKPKPTRHDFSRYKDSTAEIVTVGWNDRKCR